MVNQFLDVNLRFIISPFPHHCYISRLCQEFVGVRRFWRRRSDDSKDLEDSFAHLLAEELRRRSADDDGRFIMWNN